MSLINDMLRDLDARRQPPAAREQLALQGLGPSLARPAPAWPLGRLVLGITLAVGLAAGGLYVGSQRTPSLLEEDSRLASAAPHTVPEPVQLQPDAPRLAAPPTDTSMPMIRPLAEVSVAEPPTVADVAEAEEAGRPVVVVPLASAPPTNRRQPATTPPRETVIQRTLRSRTPAEQAHEAFAEGASALGRDQTARAETLWRQALELAPTHQQARLALAGLWLRQQRNEEALALLAAGLALEPQAPELARLHGHLLLQQGRLQEARRVLETAAPGAGQQADYQALLATLYQRLGQHALAVNHYRQALALQPDQGLWWMGLGVSLDQSHQGSAAHAAFHTALGYPLSQALQQYVEGRLAALAP